MNDLNTKDKGRLGEELAEKFLRSRGYTILAKNFIWKNILGEIDIIAQEGNKIVFIEVKSRHRHFVSPSFLINNEKKRKIIQTALFFMKKNDYSLSLYLLRFDLFYVLNKNIYHFTNAFTNSEDFYF